MARKVLLECSFLIPVRRDRNLSDGERQFPEAWAWLRDEMYEFGGVTESTQTYSGWYPDPDTRERVWDESRKFFVAITRAQVSQLRKLLGRACAVFFQKCIYLSVAGRVEFVEGENNEG
jgi:hypothetical protein